MSEFALESRSVSKKFRKGESFDSLKDLIPAMVGRAVKNPGSLGLGRSEFWALRDISFKVSRGEALGIIGHNGAGKSTLLKLLSGILKPTAGTLTVKGKLSALIEVGAGFHPDLTGRDNIFLNGVIMGMSRREIRRKFDEIVAFSGVEEFVDTPIKRYSSGMYARLGFAVAAHVDPEILLVDEVLSVGDWTYQQKCAEKMQSLIRSGAAVIFVSHNLRAVATLCQSCILLEHGRIVKSGLSEEIIAQYLDSTAPAARDDTHKKVVISEVEVFRGDEKANRFEAGEKMRVQITLEGRVATRALALHVYVVEGTHREIFETSTEFLGLGLFDIAAGQRKVITLELTAHLGRGMYHLGTVLRSRLDNSGDCDRRFPSATLYVDGTAGVLGSSNLYPVII